MNYWLLKSEPSEFSIDDLEASPKHETCWDGVRNYQARNFMRDAMENGDLTFFYHSNCAEPGIAGIARIVSAAMSSASLSAPKCTGQPKCCSWASEELGASCLRKIASG